MENRPGEGSHHDDPVSLKLDRLLDRFDKLDVWRDETDRRFDNLEPALSRVTEPPLGYEDGEEFDDDDFRQKKPWERGYRSRHPTGNCREGSLMERGRREDRYSRWKIHPTTETGRERVNPPRSPYAYNAGHQPARQPDRNPYVSRQPESHPDISYRTAPPQLRKQEPPYWMNEFAAIDGEQHRRARQPWREPQLPSFADGPDPRRIHTEYQQCGLPNSPHLKVRSPCPAQLDVISDYNEKLRVYRLEQATLLAELNAWFEENIDDANLVENVPNNAAHNAGVNLDVDVPINESREEIVKTDNMPLQVLVGVSDEKVGVQSEDEAMQGDLRDGGEILSMSNGDDSGASQVVATADVFSSKEIKMVFGEIGVSGVRKRGRSKSLKNEEVKKVNGGGFGIRKMGRPKGSKNKKKIGVKNEAEDGDVPSTNHRSTSLDTDARLIPPRNGKPCLSILGGVNRLFILLRNFAGHIRSPWLIFYGGDEGTRSAARCVFDPGGDASPRLLLSTLIVASWFPP